MSSAALLPIRCATRKDRHGTKSMNRAREPAEKEGITNLLTLTLSTCTLVSSPDALKFSSMNISQICTIAPTEGSKHKKRDCSPKSLSLIADSYVMEQSMVIGGDRKRKSLGGEYSYSKSILALHKPSPFFVIGSLVAFNWSMASPHNVRGLPRPSHT